MPRHLGRPSNVTVVTAALVMGATAQVSRAQDGNGTPFAEADVLAELNNADGDLGFHALIDGEAWELLQIEGPTGHRVLSVTPSAGWGGRA